MGAAGSKNKEWELGRGGYGVVYKGVSRSGKIIAVKKLFEIILEDDKTFRDEVNFLMEIKHQNIVQLIGYYAESSWETKKQPSGNFIWAEIPKRLLCFEYACNESLRKYISDESSGLEWNMRYEIMKGICSGLHFLHEERRIVHLDIKPENILMDSTMMPKIMDFGLSKIFGSQQSRIITKNRAGSRGYMAPEYWNQGLVTLKADIFSLGVIVIEIIIGSRDYPYFQQDSPHSTTTSLHQFTEKVLGKWRNKFASTPEYELVERYTQQVRQCITIALRCVDPIMEKRPIAKDIIQMLNALNETIQPLQYRSSILMVVSLVLTGILFGQIIDDAAGMIFCIDANQTEPLIITGHFNGCVQIWNYDTQKVVGSIKVSAECVTNVKFIARKGWFVAASCDSVVHVYNYEKGMQKVTRFRAQDRPSVKCSFAIHPTQPYVLVGCDKQIKLWAWDQGWNCIQKFEERSSSIIDLKFNPEDTNSFASASAHFTVKVWSLDSPKCKYTLSGHSHYLYCLDFFTRDGQLYLISGSNDETAKIWDMEKEKCVHTLEQESPVFQVVSHPNLPFLITGTEKGAVRVWSSTNFRLKTKLEVCTSVIGFACLMGSERVAIAHFHGVSVMEIRDEEGQGGSEGSNENSISAIDY